MEETEDDRYTLEKFIRELTRVVKVDSNVSLLLYDVDGFEVARQNKGNFDQIITSGENAINTVKAVVEHLGFEGIDRAYGTEEVNKSIDTLIKYFNCCRRRYLTTARVEE